MTEETHFIDGSEYNISITKFENGGDCIIEGYEDYYLTENSDTPLSYSSSGGFFIISGFSSI